MARTSKFPSLDFIRNEVHWLRWKWCAFRRVSVKGENDDSVLGNASGEFFGVVQRALKADTLMSICRLVDKKRTTETLKSALESVNNNIPVTKYDDLKESLDRIDQAAVDANLLDVRHTVFAHSKKDVARGIEEAATTKISTIEQIVESISDWVIKLHEAVEGKCKFDETELHSSVDRLVKRLRNE